MSFPAASTANKTNWSLRRSNSTRNQHNKFERFVLVYEAMDAKVSEWLSLTAFLGTADIGVHLVHTSRVIIASILESLFSLA